MIMPSTAMRATPWAKEGHFFDLCERGQTNGGNDKLTGGNTNGSGASEAADPSSIGVPFFVARVSPGGLKVACHPATRAYKGYHFGGLNNQDNTLIGDVDHITDTVVGWLSSNSMPPLTGIGPRLTEGAPT